MILLWREKCALFSAGNLRQMQFHVGMEPPQEIGACNQPRD